MPEIRALPAILPILLSCACSGKSGKAEQVDSNATRSAESEAVESDLRISAKLNSSKSIYPGQKIEISPSLLNFSNTKNHRVIQPGDGSSDGRREPYVYFSVEYQTDDGLWIEAPRRTVYGCGVYAADWAKGFHDLPPGGTLALDKWLMPAHERYEFQRSGNYRVQFHYNYRGDSFGTNYGDGTVYGKDNLPKEVRDIPPFHIKSEPIEIVVVRPLDVQLQAKLSHISGDRILLSDMFDLTLLNTSNDPIEVVTNWGLSFEIHGQGSRPSIDINRTTEVSKEMIEPGGSVPLLGRKDGIDGIWKYPIRNSMKVRAIYRAMTLDSPATINSNWVVVNPVER